MLERFFVLLLLLVMSGCAKKPQQLDVQVFIVTEGSENVKLGLVEVAAMPLEKVVDALRPVVVERDAALSKLDSDNAAQEKEFSIRAEQNKKDLSEAMSLKVISDQSARLARTQFIGAAEAANSAADDFIDRAHSELKKGFVGSDESVNRRGEAFHRAFVLEEELYPYSGKIIVSEPYGRLDSKLKLCINLFKLSESDDFEALKNLNQIVLIVSSKGWDYFSKHRDAVHTAARAFQDAAQQAKVARAKFEKLSGAPPLDENFRQTFRLQRSLLAEPRRFAAALPSPVISAKTDADGRCRLILPPKQRWVLAAMGERQVVTRREQYVWIVAVPEKEGTALSFILSNDNLLKAGATPLFLNHKD